METFFMAENDFFFHSLLKRCLRVLFQLLQPLCNDIREFMRKILDNTQSSEKKRGKKSLRAFILFLIGFLVVHCHVEKQGIN